MFCTNAEPAKKEANYWDTGNQDCQPGMSYMTSMAGESWACTG